MAQIQRHFYRLKTLLFILMQIVSEYIALLQDDRSEERYRREHCCWQIEEVSGFVTPEKRSPAIIAGGHCN
ncbi:hypothetical protein [Escherichia coli]|uniref:hypothetical protein n=1 Tax=Escherichia coli TaxID=562 RepID=UPI001178B1FE|nr:hypothetical protein [Escherichia coli]